LKDRTDNQWYVEPFAGGMNTIMHVSGKRIANDNNFYLIEMWKELLNGWIPDEVSRNDYYLVKENKSKYPAHYVGWVGINCSYCGVLFGSYSGKTATKIGTVRNYQAEAIRHVLKQVEYLRGVILQNKEYYDVHIPNNSIIYCDPPYEGTAGYASTFDHASFWDWVRLQYHKGHTVFVSEYNAPDDFTCVWEMEVKSSLSANGKSGGNKNTVEKLFCMSKDCIA
jgi:DNA adenine methylase